MLILGIAGGSGSGKSTLVNKIIENTKKTVAVISQDSYYYDSSHLPLEDRKKINYDHPDSIEFDLLIENIKKLKNGEEIYQPIYSFVTSVRFGETQNIKPQDIIIIEGILCLYPEELRKLMDIKIFVDCDSDIRLSRIITRDISERGKSITDTITRYKKTVKPSHLQFIEPSKRYADVIVPKGGNNEVAIHLISKYIDGWFSEDIRAPFIGEHIFKK